jgi:hypothetical protein
MTANRHYRCCFTDANDRIESVVQILGEDDAGAALQVGELLATSRQQSAELWQSSRLVGKWTSSNKPR